VAVTVASLRIAYPEFANVPVDLIEQHISLAELNTDEDVLGDRYDMAVLLRACHTIAVSSFGEKLRIEVKDGQTSYGQADERLRRAAGTAYRMVS
jgi:hypothetical protein